MSSLVVSDDYLDITKAIYSVIKGIHSTICGNEYGATNWLNGKIPKLSCTDCLTRQQTVVDVNDVILTTKKQILIEERISVSYEEREDYIDMWDKTYKAGKKNLKPTHSKTVSGKGLETAKVVRYVFRPIASPDTSILVKYAKNWSDNDYMRSIFISKNNVKNSFIDNACRIVDRLEPELIEELSTLKQSRADIETVYNNVVHLLNKQDSNVQDVIKYSEDCITRLKNDIFDKYKPESII